MAKNPMSTPPPVPSSSEMDSWWRRLSRVRGFGSDELTNAETRGGAVALAEDDADGLSLGEMEGLTDGLTLADDDALALSDNWTTGLSDDWTVGLAETDQLTLGDTETDRSTLAHTEELRVGETGGGTPTNGKRLGLMDGDTDPPADGDVHALTHGLSLGETDGLADGRARTDGNTLGLSDDWTIGLSDDWTIGLDDGLTLSETLKSRLAETGGPTLGDTDTDGDTLAHAKGLRVVEAEGGTPTNGKRLGLTEGGTPTNGKRLGLTEGGTPANGKRLGLTEGGTPTNGKRLGLTDGDTGPPADGDTPALADGLSLRETNTEGNGLAGTDELTDPPTPSGPARPAGAGRGRRRSAGQGPKGPARRARLAAGVMPIRSQLRAQPEPAYSEVVARYLRDGIFDEKHRSEILRLGIQRSDFAQAWRALGPRITAAWIGRHPGSRPWGWWHFDAPRWQRSDLPPRCRNLGSLLLGQLGEPRRRIRGVGTPSYEVLNVVPDFDYGLPTSWVSAFDESYYSGEDHVLDSRRIGAEPAEGPFAVLAPRADDPPVYESQASYLHRHGLMSPAEVQRLSADAFEPEVIDVRADDAVASASGNGVIDSTRWTATASTG